MLFRPRVSYFGACRLSSAVLSLLELTRGGGIRVMPPDGLPDDKVRHLHLPWVFFADGEVSDIPIYPTLSE
jgi:hypothetical protein